MNTTTTLLGLTLSAFLVVNSTKAQSLQWANSITGPSNTSEGINVDASGNVYTTGSFTGTADFDPGAGTYTMASGQFGQDLYVSKLDAAGNFVWAKMIGGPATNETGNDIAFDAGGNVYVVGYFSGIMDFDPGPGSYTLSASNSKTGFLLKLDAAGNFIYAKNFGGNPQQVVLDGTGNIYTTGFFAGAPDFDPGPATYTLTEMGSQDNFILKLDASANFVWAQRIGGTAADAAFALAVDGSGNVYSTGGFSGTVDFDPGAGTTTLTSTGSGDAYFLKLDAGGNFVWVKTIGYIYTNDIGFAMKLDASGNVYVTGTYNINSFLIKLDPSGNIIYNKAIGMIVPQALALDGSGSVYVSGGFYQQTDFDPGPAVFNLTPTGFDVFVSKFDVAGNFINALSMGSNKNEMANSMACDAAGNPHLTGYFTGNVDFDPGPGTFSLVSTNTVNPNSFTVKLSGGGSTPSGISKQALANNSVFAYPNPFSDHIRFELSISTGTESELAVYNVNGQIVKTIKCSLTSITLEREGLASGIYFYSVKQNGIFIATGKIIAD